MAIDLCGADVEILRRPDARHGSIQLALRADHRIRRAANALAYACAAGRAPMPRRYAISSRCCASSRRMPIRAQPGFVYAKSGEQRKAIENFRAAVGLNPCTTGLVRTGARHAALGEHREAMAALGTGGKAAADGSSTYGTS